MVDLSYDDLRASPEAPLEVAEIVSDEDAILALWEAGELSTRAAAARLSLAYREFLDLLHRRSIPVESDPFDDAVVKDLVNGLGGGQ